MLVGGWISILEFFLHVWACYFFINDRDEFFNKIGSLTSLALMFLAIIVGLDLIKLTFDSTLW